jgi:hypothetical protein
VLAVVERPTGLARRVRCVSRELRRHRSGMTLAGGPSLVVREEAAADGGPGRRAVKGNG